MITKLGLGAVAAMIAAPLMVVSVPVQAETGPAGPHRTEQYVCKTLQSHPGSRIGARKVCVARTDWEARQQHDQDRLRQVQYDALLVTNHR